MAGFGPDANLSQMFYDADSFNQDLSSWNTSNVINMTLCFEGAGSFNGKLDGWSFGQM